MSVAAIIVTHDSYLVIGKCLATIYRQAGLKRVIIIDSGSSSIGYLQKLKQQYPVIVSFEDNIGFAQANNLGFGQCCHDVDYVTFINPDAFLTDNVFHKAIATCTQNPSIGCLTGKLLKYNIESGGATNSLDSTGIFRKWYGRWVDRGQGEIDIGQYEQAEKIPAACGAFLFCRMKALKEIQAESGYLFDPDFFMYKEDIDLCLRIKKLGWQIIYDPRMVVYHCRGWHAKRNTMPYKVRLLSAENEVLLYRKHPSIYMLWALLKYTLVRFIRI